MKSAYHAHVIRPSEEKDGGKVIDMAAWREAHRDIREGETDREDSTSRDGVRRWEQAALGLELLASLAILCAMSVLTLQMLSVF